MDKLPLKNTCNHEFKPLKVGYYKLDKRKTELSNIIQYDQSISYATLYCPKCGCTTEVVAGDHRQ